MTVESIMGSCTPLRITGDVDIARFPLPACNAERWRVSIDGKVHFLTDADTAWRLAALASGSDFAKTYSRYASLAGANACTLDAFIAWSHRHRTKLEQLAETTDTHSLIYRHLLLSGQACQGIARPLVWLFHRVPAFLIMVLSATLVCAFVATSPGISRGSFWLVMPLVLLGIFVHEIAHITACVRHGARQGGIGVGLYWIWPAFYADVRGSWSLPASQRLQVSAGGLYFQLVYVAILASVSFVTGTSVPCTAIHITLLLMATTCNPVFKYDGYWILSDLFNATNIHSQITEHLRNLLHPHDCDRRGMIAARLTWLSFIFSLSAIGYIAFIGVELFHSASTGLRDLASNWHELEASTPAAISRHLWFRIAGLVLQLVLVTIAMAVMGTRSLRATSSILRGRGRRTC